MYSMAFIFATDDTKGVTWGRLLGRQDVTGREGWFGRIRGDHRELVKAREGTGAVHSLKVGSCTVLE